MTPIVPSSSGGLNASKIGGSAYVLTDLTPAEQSVVQIIAQSGDQYGNLTEAVVNDIGSRQGLTLLGGGKYGSNNGFDHVFQSPDGTVTILMDSKQMNDGVIKLSAGAGGAIQMSDAWVANVLRNLDQNSAAYKAVKTALDDGTLVKGVAAVDKATGAVTIVRVQ